MTPRPLPDPSHIPTSTYRLQLNRDFTFPQATGIVDYLSDLGIGDCYLSPILMAPPGSPHGYDVTNHSRLNPEIGTIDEFHALSRRLKERGMGLIADVVPNHMSVGHPTNEWWWDVLENGPSSPFANYFDIDWHPPKTDLACKVLCPILGDQYGRVLEDQQISVIACENGGFLASVYDKVLPLAPRSWALLLNPALTRLKTQLGEADPHVMELESIVTALSHLAPADEPNPERVRERRRETDTVRRRLTTLSAECLEAREAIENCRREINGTKGDPHSFDRLEELLAGQSYRLCYWRVASDEINYRRFFDVNDLAAIRVEDPEVFHAVHGLIFELVKEGHIDGLRVDHPDGLRSPKEYFSRLQEGCRVASGKSNPFYIVCEKILANDEQLPLGWEVAGTTGYDLLAVLNGLFVDRDRRRAFHHLYGGFTGWLQSSGDLVYECKRLILQTSLASELNLLTNQLDRVSEQHRWSRDFTRESLRLALRETIACFPIYRTYTAEDTIRPETQDEHHIRVAIEDAKRRNRSTNESIFDFLRSVLLLEDPEGIDAAQRAGRRHFVLSFQQFTGPVMAKGVEDTAFYRHVPLASLNEVGGESDQFGATPAEFHSMNWEHHESWPHTMLATSTHDSKRGEDVRARINVLSEIPADWYRAIRRWSTLNRPYKVTSAGTEVPSPAEEYFIYENLLGIWPSGQGTAKEREELAPRLKAYMQKSLREAKIHTSWINPNGPYEGAVDRFIEAVLDDSRAKPFLDDFAGFVSGMVHAGMWNSLSQTLLKIASPGVPDFYQGTELWNLSLVDPDNRRPVDYELRRNLLNELKRIEGENIEESLDRLMRLPEDGAIKLYVTSRALQFRRAHAGLMSQGQYISMRAIGEKQNHVVGFGRAFGSQSAVAVAGRFFMGLGERGALPLGRAWGDTVLSLRKEPAHPRYRDIFTHRVIEVEKQKGKRVLPLAKVFSHLPVALLIAVE